MVVFFTTLNVFSQTRVAAIFNHHMVLQRNTEAQVWGTDKPNTVIEVIGSWGEKSKTKSDSKGNWSTTIKTINAGGPYELNVQGSTYVEFNDILLGEVWICTGQSNMAMKLKGGPGQHIEDSNEMILNSKNSKLRFITIKKNISTTPVKSLEGNWEVSEPKTAANFSAVGYVFGLRLQKYLNVPVGLISSNVGGTPAQAWTPKNVLLKDFPEFKKEYSKKVNTKSPSVLYNGMIHPIIPFTIKGAIWYQGEGNRWNPKQYSNLFPAMIKSWRTNWKQGEFPFYFVQLAPYGRQNIEGWVGVQQAQNKTMQELKNTGMAVINDIGYASRIHPPKKKEVGQRLALWALVKDYKVEGLVHSGPVYKSKKIKDNKIMITFDKAPSGITSMGKDLSDFEISDANGVFYPAEVKITKNGTNLEVWNKKIKKPKNVRYGWKSYIEGSLFNTAGLPASAFSTESWDEVFKTK